MMTGLQSKLIFIFLLAGGCAGAEFPVPIFVLESMASNETMTIFAGSPSLEVLVNETKSIYYHLAGNTTRERITFDFVPGTPGVIFPVESKVILNPNSVKNFSVDIKGYKRGKCNLKVLSSDPAVSTKRAFVNIKVLFSNSISSISIVIGWIYFFAWSVSFYPQIYENYRRKSVIGLNFDFLTLNVIGFTLYSVYNVGLFWVGSIQSEYMDRHETLVIPVKLNDVIFGIHAIFACALTIAQCFIYEKGDQRVSTVCWFVVLLICLFIVSILVSSAVSSLKWLDFLTYASYVKLGITIVKYMPQAYMNFVRKSTSGWSIGNVILDFTGGSLSMGQMIMDSYNNDDWTSFFGDFTKFGLGFFSVAFDILFILQHYVCYRNRTLVLVDMERIPESNEGNEEESVRVGSPTSYGSTEDVI